MLFSDFSAESKYCDDSNALVVGKMEDEMKTIDTEEFVRLKPKMQSILMSNSKESKKAKAKGVNKNVLTKISHN